MTDEEKIAPIRRFDEHYKPSEGGGQRPGLDLLPDGDYHLEIVSAELTATKKTGQSIFRLSLKVLDLGSRFHGQIVERASFFTSQENVDILGADLLTLGFDSDQWTTKAGRPFSSELLKAAPQLVGLCFRGQKVAKESDKGKSYHNLYINRRLTPAEIESFRNNDPTAADESAEYITNADPSPQSADTFTDGIPF